VSRANVGAVIFATGVLGIPSALYSLGALPGALSVVGWGALNTCEFLMTSFERVHVANNARLCCYPRKFQK